jgi:hypothetical protein
MSILSENLQRKIILVLCLVSILLTISCACLPSRETLFSQEPTATEKAAATATKPVPSKTPTEKPQPTATSTIDAAIEATDLADLLNEEEDMESQRPWSLPVYPDAVLFVSDLDEDAEYDNLVATHTRNLAIEAPYYYEFYDMPAELTYNDVRSYFQEVLPPLGYKQAADFEGEEQIFLLTFVNAGGSISRKIAIQYWQAYDMIMIIYKNPD